MSKKEYIVNWNIEEPVSVKGKTTLVFQDAKISELNFYVQDKVFICNRGDENVFLTDYSKIKYAKTSEDEGVLSTDLITESRIINNIIYDTPVKNKITGTNYNDTVNLVDYIIYDDYGNPVDDFLKNHKGVTVSTLSGKDTIVASQYSDVISAGNGNDTVYSSLGNDKITGGKGENKIVYSGFFDTDTITLTKGEELILDVSSYFGLTGVDDLSFKLTSKNLEIKIEDDENVYGTIILKNFKKNSVVGSKGSVLLDFGLEDLVDLNSAEFLYWNKYDFSNKGVFTGTRFSETIDASEVYVPYGKNNKGVTIKGGAGYNTIIGTDGFNDTITGGNDGNNITVGSGTNKITTGKGIDTIIVNGGQNTIKTGKGDDEINLKKSSSSNVYAGAGKNLIKIDNSAEFGNIVIKEEKVGGENDIVFVDNIDNNYTLKKDGKNLIIRTQNSSLKIENFYLTGKKYAKNRFFVGEIEYTIDEISNISGGFEINGKGKIEGTDGKDAIVANDYTGKKVSDDIIIPKKGNDIINAGKGNNSIYLYENDGDKTVRNGGGIDTLFFEGNADLSLEYSGNDLVITYGVETDKIKITDYRTTESSVKYLNFGDKNIELATYNKSITIPPNSGEHVYANNIWEDTLIFEEGTEFLYDYVDGALIINYGEETDNIILEDFVNTLSIKYLKVGDDYIKLANFYMVLERGEDAVQITVNENETANLILSDRFDGVKYNYEIKSLKDSQTVTLEHLKNGRVYIKGNNLEINANDSQKDDMIIMGSNNIINTGDKDDILRLGYVVDSRGEVLDYIHQSDENVINTGDGNDYIEYFGLNNKTDAGDGFDEVYVYANNAILENENITNAEIKRMTKTSIPINNEINWFNQGEGGGDCRLFAILDSLSKQDGFNLSDYVDITDNLDDTYTVTFKNYTVAANSLVVSKSDLSTFRNVYGDIDVILIDYAMNSLIAQNKLYDKQALETYAEGQISIHTLDTVQKAYYNTLSNYIFGNFSITPVNYDSNLFETRLYDLWTAYQNKEISNITVGIQADFSDYKNGILTAHAYSMVELTEEFVTLINPWDSADKLTIDLDILKSMEPCLMVYGTDKYNERYVIDNGFIRAENTAMDDVYLDNINNDTANWLTFSSSQDMAEMVYNSNNSDVSAEILCMSDMDYTV